MTVGQLPEQVLEFARYLNGLVGRLDGSGGWCGVFWQRDPDGMRACLEGQEVPPWDVVEALLQDVLAQYGERAAAQEAARAHTLYEAALAAYDVRPGARDALGDRLDVMLREQRYAAERQAELSGRLPSAVSRGEAEAIRLDLAWAQDDHERATARCAELRHRMDNVDRHALRVRAPGFPAPAAGGGVRTRQPENWADPSEGHLPGRPPAGGNRFDGDPAAGDPYGAGGVRPGRGTEAPGGAAEPGPPPPNHAPGHDGHRLSPSAAPAPDRDARPLPPSDRTPGYDAQPGSRPADHVPGTHAQPLSPADRTPGYGARPGSRPAEHSPGTHAQPQSPADRTPGYDAQPGSRPADHVPGQHAPGYGARPGSRPADHVPGTHAQPQSPADRTPGYDAQPRSRPADHVPGHHAPGYDARPPSAPVEPPSSGLRAHDRVAGPAPAHDRTPPGAEAPSAKRSKRRRRGGARFAGMVEADAPAVVPETGPSLPAPPAQDRRTPRGARFAGAAEEPAPPPSGAGAEPLDEDARRLTAEAVATLTRLRSEGRSGEAHAVLVEAAYWPPARFPLLAAELHRAGLGADWATLLWEAASLPADRLVAAADALTAADRTADGRQMLRQGVSRPAPEIGAAVLGLADEGRGREISALLDAYVRVRTPEEAARSAETDPQRLVPLLLRAARGVSDECQWDLVHALRVAGLTA
ncbi:hypothetical protein ACF07B_12190 [Streptomyces sp. NPDC015532]|uniref:hypothetical protein n=1 Tax=Streptomyces sp. NPDC015532 TaxID=3364960 RepID=UPI0036F9F45D